MADSGNQAVSPRERRGLPQSMRNVASNWGGYVFSIVITFFVSPFVVHHLGDTAYGVWVLVISLTGSLGLLDMGVRGAVTRYVAKYQTLGDHAESSRIASTAVAIFSGLGGVAMVVSTGLAFLADLVFQIPSAYHLAVHVVLPIAGLTVAVSFTGGVFSGILVGLQRFDLVNSIEVVASAVRALLIVLVLKLGYGIIALSLVQLVYSLGSAIVRAWMAHRLYPELKIGIGTAQREEFRMIFSFSMYSFLLNICSYLILYTDSVVIGVFQPVRMITFFSIAGNLINYSRGLLSGITTTLSPMASRLEAGDDHVELQRITLKGSCYASALILPISITFMLRGSTFIRLWMGPSYAQLSGEVLWVLALGTLISSAVAVPWAVMFGIGKHKAMVPAYLAESLSNLLLSIFLVRQIGIVGVAWGTAIPSLMVCLLFWPPYIRRTLKISMPTYAMAAWLRPTVALLPFAASTYMIEKWWPVSKLLIFFVQVGAALPFAAVGIWYFCLSATDRRNYMQYFRQTLSGLLGMA